MTLDILADGQPDDRPHRRLDGRPADLAVALRRVPVADGEPGARHEHRQEQRRADDEVARVHVAAVDVGRDRAERPARRGDPHLAAERRERDPDTRPELGAPGPAGHGRHLVERVGELVGQQPEARDGGRPAPVGRLQVDDVDLERVARFRAVDLAPGR